MMQVVPIQALFKYFRSFCRHVPLPIYIVACVQIARNYSYSRHSSRHQRTCGIPFKQQDLVKQLLRHHPDL